MIRWQRYCLLAVVGCVLDLRAAVGQIPDGIGFALEVSTADRITAVRHAGDSRLFVVRQPGVIVIYDGSQVLEPEFLDIRTLVTDGGERGLLGLAFHPNFASNGYFYVNYTQDNNSLQTVVARYTVSAQDSNRGDSASALELLRVDQPASNHNGGDMHFGPDGYLYIGMGDGGISTPAQDTGSLLGKMLRIDVDGSPAADGELCGINPAYGIPAAGNPFAPTAGGPANRIFANHLEAGTLAGKGANPAGCDEIWALGLRNPWRWSFDRLTGAMVIGDVGQGAQEEIDFQPPGAAGLNYGWDCREGTLPFSPTAAGCQANAGLFVEPVLVYGRDLGVAVTGGFVYRGSFAPLQGKYFYADYGSGRIWIATDTNGAWTTELWQDTSFSIATFGEDVAGELYFADAGGAIYRITTP